jgi:Flp pilus assembly protein TadD
MPRKFAVALLAAVALATYWNGLDAPFVWDDDTAITTNQSIHEITTSLIPPIETPVAGRPVVNLSLAINYAMAGVDKAGGLETKGFHAANLAVHTGCALLLFGIVSRTLRRRRCFSDKAPVDSVALAAALVWMVHPLLSETIDYTTQRTESMMGLFFLLTLYAAIRARGKRGATLSAFAKASADRRSFSGGWSGSPTWTLIAVASCAAGMATKESMAVAPVAVVLYDLIFEFDSPAEAWASRKALYVGLAATWVELGAIMWRWPRSTVGGTAVSPITYALNQAQMIARYLWLSVWPRSLVVDYGVPQPLRISDVVPQGALILALIAATIVALVRWPAAGFLGAMFFLTLAPTSSVVPILSEVGAERRMYLPLAALVVLVVSATARAIDRWRTKTAWRVAGASVVVAVTALALRTVDRNRDYASPLTLWQSVVDRRPQGRARFGLANQLMDAGRHEEATAQLRLAVPDYPDARAGLGTELLVQGQLDEGIRVLDAFVAADPSLPNRGPARALLAQAHRAIAERELSKQNAALAAVEARKSVDLDGTNADAHNILGAALASQGNLAAAIPEFQAAVRINPRHPSAANNLARAMAMDARTPQTPSADPRKAR